MSVVATESISFAFTPGAVAWARRPGAASTGASADANASTSDWFWWPVLLFPTWKDAAHTGLMDLSSSDAKGEAKIQILGCKRTVAVDQLRSNRCPQSAVLRPIVPNRPDRPGRQNRVVAHFLGLRPCQLPSKSHRNIDDFADWAAIDAMSLRPYRDHAHDILSWCRGRVTRHDWVDLLRAVDEASELLQDFTVTSEEMLLNIPVKDVVVTPATTAVTLSAPSAFSASAFADCTSCRAHSQEHGRSLSFRPLITAVTCFPCPTC